MESKTQSTSEGKSAQAPAGQALPDGTVKATRALLYAGAAAGPVYIGISLIEMLIRPGFDLRRHSLSLLSNGSLGWIHIGMFLATGLLTILGALGIRRALRGSRGGAWAPLLLGLYGLGLIGAGIFSADPALGFPPGTPLDAHAVSWHGVMHLVSGGLGFLGLIAATLVLARRFAGLRQRGWAIFSAATGVLFFAAFYGIATGSQPGPATVTFVNLAFAAAVVLAWAWISSVALHLLNGLNR